MARNLIFTVLMLAIVSAGRTFPADVKELKPVRPSRTISLKDGDTYTLTAGFVRQKIGNKSIKALAYNGSIPGPLIKIKKGSTVTIKLVNKTGIKTTLHSHGVRLANPFDGVARLTQPAVVDGDTYIYKIKFPDEGIYIYHPHIRTDYTIESGLFGNYIVTSKDPNYFSPVNREVPLVLDDISTKGKRLAPFYKDHVDHTLSGRFGNIMLINGDPDYRLRVRRGEVVRFYVTNIANTRTINLAVRGARTKLVGADNGKYEREKFVESVVLSPTERAIIEVLFDKPGLVKLENRTPEKTFRLGEAAVDTTPAGRSFLTWFDTLRVNSKVIDNIDRYRRFIDKKIDKQFTLTAKLKGRAEEHKHGGGGGRKDDPLAGIEWQDTMDADNARSTSRNVEWRMIDAGTGRRNLGIKWDLKAGSIARVRISNDPGSAHPMQHPIHFHGQRFLVTRVNEVRNDNLVWKDTVLVREGDDVEILLDAANKGKWQAHCHIAEHFESGMMLNYTVR